LFYLFECNETKLGGHKKNKERTNNILTDYGEVSLSFFIFYALLQSKIKPAVVVCLFLLSNCVR